jgi:hypothetical protein
MTRPSTGYAKPCGPARSNWSRRPPSSWLLVVAASALAVSTLYASAWPWSSVCAMGLALVGWLVVGVMSLVRGCGAGLNDAER